MAEIGLGFRRNENESWKDAMIRYATKYGLEEECIESYEADIKAGSSEEQASYDALYDWDLLDMYVDGKPEVKDDTPRSS